MDPALQLALRAAFALLLATAASHKLRDLAGFCELLAGYEIMPRAIVGAVARAVTLAEAILAAMLLFGVGVPLAGALVSTLLLAYGAAIHVNVRRGRTDIDCGCMGPASRVPLGHALVVRNLLLAFAAALLLVPEAPRELALLDGVSVVATSAALSACWLASERLLALAPRVVALRRTAS